MRLIDVNTRRSREFYGESTIPPYAILSHTWTDEEVTYQDWLDPTRRAAKEKGYSKIKAACAIAQKMRYDFLWCDTNCINKESSAELSEAINSMFVYYQDSGVCIVYLEDYNSRDKASSLESSRWFSRGWTLQELLAPQRILFFDRSWIEVGTKESLIKQISMATSINSRYLRNLTHVQDATIAQRMSWASARKTTRIEDEAYCLLGIFDINMPLLYGEGPKAFIRLQEEIIKHNNDQTIFCWHDPKSASTPLYMLFGWRGCLAPQVGAFHSSGEYIRGPAINQNRALDFQLTNTGLRITLPRLKCVVPDFSIAFLMAMSPNNSPLCICFQTLTLGTLSRWFLMGMDFSPYATNDEVYLLHLRNPTRARWNQSPPSPVISASTPSVQAPSRPYAILPMYTDTNDFAPIPLVEWGLGDEKFGPIIPLKEDETTGLWTTTMCVKSTSDTVMVFDFYARIDSSKSFSWYAVWGCTMRFGGDRFQKPKTRRLLKARTEWLSQEDLNQLLDTLRNEKPRDTQIVPSDHEFEITTDDGPMMIRPVVVSFKAVLGSSWA